LNKTLIDLQYLPSLEYFCALLPYQTIIIEKHEHFIKQSFHNRCYILGPHKTERLVIPVRGGQSKITVGDIKIDNRQKWVNQHWRSIQSAYGKAPFFEYYADDFSNIFHSKEESLFNFNLSLLTLCLKVLGLQPLLQITEKFQEELAAGETDLRNLISPKKTWQVNNIYHPSPYTQVFGNKFVENLSILDLIFCEGNQALKILRDSSLNT